MAQFKSSEMTSSLFLLCSILFFFTLYPPVSNSELVVPLTNSLQTAQFNSTQHLLKHVSTRSRLRFSHHLRNRNHVHREVSLPLSPGSDYSISFTLGLQNPQTVSLYMDTGSDVVWFPCSPFECILCEEKIDPRKRLPVANVTSTSAVTCKSSACSAAHSSSLLSSSDLCAIAGCPLESIETSDCRRFRCPPFYYAYGDGSFIARLYQDTMSISMSSPPLVLRNFTFGCAHTALGEPIGVAGFGRGVLSLPAQLSSLSPQLGNRFSYCLVSHSFVQDRVRSPSPLILGRLEGRHPGSEEFVYTEILENPKHPYFYSVGLEGISVGKRKIPAPESLQKVDRVGSGGMVVDSGTTFTMLPASLYESVVGEFDSRVGRVHRRARPIEHNTGLGPCYYFDNDKAATVPALTLHFVGNGSSMSLPRKNYLYEFLDGGDGTKTKRKVGCLMLMNAGDEKEMEGGPLATLGNYQQQEFEVVYDLENQKVGFARRKCAALWNNLRAR